MEVTDEMLQAAMKAAVRVKILPKLAGVDTYLEHWAGMRKVLEAALDAAPVSNRADGSITTTPPHAADAKENDDQTTT